MARGFLAHTDLQTTFRDIHGNVVLPTVNYTGPAPPLDPTSSLRTPLMLSSRYTPPRTFLAGFGTKVLPLTYATNDQNLVAALQHRVLHLKPPPDRNRQRAIAKVLRWELMHSVELYPDLRQCTPLTWTAYLNRYPPARARELIRGRDALESGEYGQRIYVTVPFPKVEHSVLIDEQGGYCKPPRAVSSCASEANVQTGPAMVAAMHELSRVWSPGHLIVATCGMQPHEIGRALYDASLGGMYVYEYDHTKFETKRYAWTHQMERTLVKRMGLDVTTFGNISVTEAMRRAQPYRARTRSKIKAKAKDVLTSGRPDTTFGNTLTNGITCAAVMAESARLHDGALDWSTPEELSMRRFRAFVNGDDSVIFSPVLLDPDIASVLGFKLTGGRVASVFDATFCSQALMPAEELTPNGWM